CRRKEIFMGDLTEHFSRREFECSCGCRRMNVKGRLLLTLSRRSETRQELSRVLPALQLAVSCSQA
ncbi:MAG: hypothetical protein LBC93_04745, partial [Synergistaceae bacterium]|nr:hypothetical protein [Synergistaceae bacterium]